MRGRSAAISTAWGKSQSSMTNFTLSRGVLQPETQKSEGKEETTFPSRLLCSSFCFECSVSNKTCLSILMPVHLPSAWAHLENNCNRLLSYMGLSSFLNNTAFHFPAIYSLINAVENLKWSINYKPSVPQTVVTSLHWLELSYFLHRLKLATDFVTYKSVRVTHIALKT